MTYSNLNFAKYRRIIVNRKLVIIFVSVLFFVCSAVFAVWKAFPPLYSSTCSIKFEKELTLGDLFSRVLSLSEGDNIETQQAIITSYDLLLEVAKNLSLAAQTESANDPNAHTVVEDLRGKIQVEREKDSNIINIVVTDNDPVFSQRMANELARTYRKQRREYREKQLKEVISYIDGQLQTLRNQLQNSETQFNRLSQKNQLLSIDQQSADLLLRKNELEDKIRIKAGPKNANDLKLELREINEKINSLMEKKLEYNRLKREIESSRSMVSFLEKKNQEAMIRQAEKPDEVEIVKQAQLPSKPVNPQNIAIICLIGTATGIIVGFILALGLEIFGNPFGIIEDIEKTLDVRIMGIIPLTDNKKIIAGMSTYQGMISESANRYLDMVSHFAPKTMIAESFRALRTNIQFTREERKVKTIAVTSSYPREGKSMITANLALSLAQTGLRTLLVGSDIRSPMLAKIFSIEDCPGLTDILLGTCAWQDVIKTVTDMVMGGMPMDDVMMTPGLDNLNLITSGRLPPNPAELMNSREFTEFIQAAENEYDIIILDSSPALSTADAAILGAQVDAVLIVYRPEELSTGVLKRTITQLKQVNCYLMGVVLNGVNLNLIPAALRQKYSGYPSSGGHIHTAATGLEPGNGRKKNVLFKALVCLAALVLLISGIWWKRDEIFPKRFFQSETEERNIEIPQKVRPVKKGILPKEKSEAVKKEAPSYVKEPPLERTAPVTDESIDKVESKAGAPKEARPGYPEGRYPYSIYLGSFKNTERAQKAIDIYTRKHIPSFWVKVNLAEIGTWYRVYSGHYPDEDSALAFIEENNIKNAEIKRTAYACYIESFTDDEGLENRIRLLKEKQYSPYIIDDDTSNLRSMFVGAYITRGAAEKLSEDLRADGIKNMVVSR